MNCTHCLQSVSECSCNLCTLWENAIVGCVHVTKNPNIRQDIEHALRNLNIVRPPEKLVSYHEKTIFTLKGGESYGADFVVGVEDISGRRYDRHVYAKAIITPFAEYQTKQQARRLALLHDWGIRVPFIYGHAQDTLYLDYIPSNWSELTNKQKALYLKELIKLAAILDLHGAQPIDFIRDLLLDPVGHLYYADVGSDLGELKPDGSIGSKKYALDTLLTYFGEHHSAIVQTLYQRWLDRLSINGSAEWETEQNTLVLLKPDAVEKDLEPIIVAEITALGLKIVGRKKIQLTPALVEDHYAQLKNKPFFPAISAYMRRHHCIALIVRGSDSVATIRNITGATDPIQAENYTWRGRYGTKIKKEAIENVVHASATPEEAEGEIERFFTPKIPWIVRLWRRLKLLFSTDSI